MEYVGDDSLILFQMAVQAHDRNRGGPGSDCVYLREVTKHLKAGGFATIRQPVHVYEVQARKIIMS